ncbi:MAG: response regulator [Gemmatimonadetes bacterium]|nr:response regulator [Gemmatimonadota bacterium]NNK47286.1 response regulator [Gemmatimonadota bacterium]
MRQEMRRKILLVEDNPDIARGLAIRLKGKGYDIVGARDATVAMTMAVKERPDVVIMDIGLPGGDGHLVHDRLGRNANTAAIPVIFLTARAQPESMQRALEAGAVAYLTKPYRAEELLSAVEMALGD